MQMLTGTLTMWWAKQEDTVAGVSELVSQMRLQLNGMSWYFYAHPLQMELDPQAHAVYKNLIQNRSKV